MELLERDRSLQELAAGLDKVRAGAGSLLLVSGEAGIGKTADKADASDQTLDDACRAVRANFGQ